MSQRPTKLPHTVALRLPPALYKWVRKQIETGETLSDALRRLLTEYKAQDGSE